MLSLKDFKNDNLSLKQITGGANELHSITTPGGQKSTSGAISESDEVFYEKGQISKIVINY